MIIVVGFKEPVRFFRLLFIIFPKLFEMLILKESCYFLLNWEILQLKCVPFGRYRTSENLINYNFIETTLTQKVHITAANLLYIYPNGLTNLTEIWTLDLWRDDASSKAFSFILKNQACTFNLFVYHYILLYGFDIHLNIL